MRLRSLLLDGFGQFRGIRIDFEEGLNVLVGDNESGKTTVADAILATLYGIDQRKEKEKGLYSRYEPLDGGCFAATLYVGVGGLRIYRDFRNPRNSSLSVKEGDLWAGVRDWNLIYREIGVDTFALFRSLLLVSGSDVVIEAKDQGAISEAVSLKTSAGGEGATVREALTKLDARRRQLENAERKACEERLRELLNRQEQIYAAERRADELHAQLKEAVAEYEEEKHYWDVHKPIVDAYDGFEQVKDEYEGKVKAQGEAVKQRNQIASYVASYEAARKAAKVASESQGWARGFRVALGIGGLVLVAVSFISMFVVPGLAGATCGMGVVLLTVWALWRARKVRQLRVLEDEVERLGGLVEALLNGRKFCDLEKEADELSREVAVLKVAYEDARKVAGAFKPEDIFNYRKRLDGIDVRELEHKVDNLRTVLEEHRRSTMPWDPWEVETGMACAKKELAGLQTKAAAIRQAIDLLGEAFNEVQQGIVPFIEKRTGEILKHITGGRYGNVRLQVNSDGFEVGIPGGATQWVPDRMSDRGPWGVLNSKYLSSGTLDQLYFALRIALAEALTGRNDFPLILDDPFITYDVARLEGAIRFLGELSKQHQVILLTKDSGLGEMVRKVIGLGKGKVIRFVTEALM